MMTVKKQSIRNVAIYLRLSKDDGDKEESESISNQRNIILDYLRENFEYENYYEYVDDGVSGATFNRPGFRKMISELKTNKIDLVITKNLARFARNYIEAGEYIEKIFPNNNIRYIAIIDGVDNFEDRIANEFAPIRGVFNELFCKETSKAVKRSKRKKMTEGFYSCTVAPFGYKKDLENPGKLIIDYEASKVVKRIFKMALEGKTAMEIADKFNEEKIKTPAEYLSVKGLENRTKKIWSRSMIARILVNKVYIGDCLRGKTQNISYKSKKRIHIRRNEQIVTKNTHEAIISEEMFDKIHNNNKFGSKKGESQEFVVKFANYLYCGKCKSKISKRKLRNKIKVCCPYRNETNFLCSNNELYNYEEIERAIIDAIRSEFELYFKKKKLNPNVIARYNKKQIEDIDKKTDEINKELGMLRFKISKLYNDRLQENITEEYYKSNYEKLVNTRKELTNQCEILEKQKNKINGTNENMLRIKKVKKILKKLDKESLSEDDIGEMIDKIYLYEDHIHIFYKFQDIQSKIISCEN